MKVTLVPLALLLATPAFAQTAPTPPAAADPARQAAAARAVAALIPDGIYMTMMRDKFPQLMDMMIGRMGGMTASDLGVPATDKDQSGGGQTLRQMAMASDPAFDERMRITMRVMSEEMGTLFTRIEPRMRAGMAKAFARQFTTAQLDDMNRFFATPSGSAFADRYLLTFMDPDVMQEMMGAMPEMMQAMPAIMAKVDKATAHLPPVKKKTGDEK